MLRIEYQSEGFGPGGPVSNGGGMLDVSWDELLGAAITVGRPNRQYVFRHGIASVYEAIFRLSLIRMALEQSGPGGRRLRRTSAARTLDPSEKGAINYFLGLTICSVFARRLLNAPWLLHLDVFRPALNPVLRGRSRPDLVGQTVDGRWIALECKGRVSPPDSRAKNNAKLQAARLVSVNGTVPSFQIGGIAYFKNETLRFFWRDPPPNPETVKKPIDVVVTPLDWQHHYRPVVDLLRSQQDYLGQMRREPVLMPVDAADIQVGVHPEVLSSLLDLQWEEARHIAASIEQGLETTPYRADGIAVVAGDSWRRPFDEE